jgi:hypothetical protein
MAFHAVGLDQWPAVLDPSLVSRRRFSQDTEPQKQENGCSVATIFLKKHSLEELI